MIAPADDFRGGWTSASGAEYDALCPGRHLAQRGIPEPPQSEDAASGIRTHSWLAGDKVELTAAEREIADACLERYTALVKAWSKSPLEDLAVYRERRLWMEFGADLKHSGKPDLVVIDEENSRALVVDWKTGRSEVADNPRNMQLRDLAVLVAINHEVEEVTVAILQPWAPAQSPCVYGGDELCLAYQQLVVRVRASNDPSSPRTPGPVQCQYCRAKATCPEFAAQNLPVPLPDKLPTTEQLTETISNLPDANLGEGLVKLRMLIEVWEQEVRKRGGVAGWWKLLPGRERKTITDPQAVFDRFVLAGGTTGQFLQTITVHPGKLKDQVRETCNVKGKALDAKMAEMLDGLTESKQGNPVLERE